MTMAEEDGVRMTVLGTSIQGTFPVFVVMLAGVVASKFPKNEPLLSRESCRIASRLTILFFQPALTVASIGSTLTLSSLRDSWQLPASATFTIFMSFATAWLFGRVFLGPQDRRDFMPVQLAITFPNAGGFPLLLMDALCQQDTIKSDFNGDAEECLKSATAMIFIYLAVWKVLFFSWGFDALGNHRSLELKLSGQSADSGGPMGDIEDSFDMNTGTLAQTEDGLGNDKTHRTEGSDDVSLDMGQFKNETAITMSTLDVRCNNYREARNNGQWKGETNGSQGKTTTAPGMPKEKSPLLSKQAVPSTTPAAKGKWVDISKGTPDTKETTSESRMNVGKSAACGDHVMKLLVSPNILSVLVGIAICTIPFMQKIIFTNPRGALLPFGAAVHTLGTPAVALSTVVMAGSLLQVPTVAGKANGEGKWSRGRITMGALHIVCRLIAFPAVGFTAFWLANTKSSIMGSNRLMHLILLIEFVVPSASTVIVSLNQLRMPATAEFMARLYIVQYIISMFTVSAWTAIALRMVY